MTKKIIFILIIALAFILRFYQLGFNPPSLDWDEASLGYNAYSILKTGRDEYDTFMPTAIRSFGDYKPPLYTYLTTIPVALFGLNEFSTRFISALFGTLSIVVGYYLIKELLPEKSSKLYLLFSLLFAISPWHIQFSRIAFEANLAVFFFITGFWLFLKAISNGRYFLLSFISFALSSYSYHSPRLVVPILIAGMIVIFRKTILPQKRWLALSIILFIIITLPILKDLGSSAARLSSVTVMSSGQGLGLNIKDLKYDQERYDSLGKLMHNRRGVFAKESLAGYLDHFNFDFLFLTGDGPGRHHAAGMGMLYIWDMPFILIGIYHLLKNRNPLINALFLWFLLAPLAASFTTGTPHAVRSLLYVPTYQIFTAVGFFELITLIRESKRQDLAPVASVLITFLLVINFFYYLHMYWVHTPLEYSQWWQYGYKQVVSQVNKLENNYSKVIVSYYYDQPYIFFLFYNRVDPDWYQHNWGSGEIKRAERQFGKYQFRGIDWEKDKNLKNVVLVGPGQEIPGDAPGLVSEIHFLDGSVAFRIVAK